MALRDIRRLIDDRGIRFVDFRFVDLIGVWHHITYAIESYEESMFVDGIGFDGSSVRGFQAIDKSDMLLQPDPETAFVDPFFEQPTLAFICNIKDPISLALYSRDPRNIAQKAVRYLNASQMADVCYFGPEAEFYIFDDVRYEQTANEAFYRVDSASASWNSGRDEAPNLAHKPAAKQAYFRVPPVDPYQDLRSRMVSLLRGIDVNAELHHHEVGSGGQSEIGLQYAPLVQMADSVVKFKYVVKNAARAAGHTATFMPKPLLGDNGSGMHCHVSLWKRGENLFYDANGYAGLSDMGRWFIGGLLEHSPAVLAFTCPTANSYRRLVPGFEAPVKLVYSMRNRSAAVRIPMYSPSPSAKRVEFRCPDPTCNPYLAMSAILMAGVDGIENRTEPPEPIDKDIYTLPKIEQMMIRDTPATLRRALLALERDNDFLLRADVFTPDVLEAWMAYKRNHELAYIDQRPHPAEFALYYDL